MPTYDFECKKCGEVREVRRRIDDRATGAKCPECGGLMVRRFGGKAPGIQFRGEGWTGAQRRG